MIAQWLGAAGTAIAIVGAVLALIRSSRTDPRLEQRVGVLDTITDALQVDYERVQRELAHQRAAAEAALKLAEDNRKVLTAVTRKLEECDAERADLIRKIEALSRAR